MTHAYIFWIKEELSDIIPIRDLKLNSQQKKIRDEIGGLGHVVGSVLKARHGDDYYDAKVLQIGSSKELSEADETLYTAEIKYRKESQKQRRRAPPNRYGQDTNTVIA
ncbi:hypothetical protein JTE90_006166 [Oedothorax gibbosus]|uniref:Uncharacterized protein n=1 Tax=Oedothorax gibbosus TaxID=931172 RepID=A0AAV6TJM1_9ARAC|nr:hypothetical protein JTE90_006166 [Oedothorax gibbosus]